MPALQIALSSYTHALQKSARYDLRASLRLVHLWLASSADDDVNRALLELLKVRPPPVFAAVTELPTMRHLTHAPSASTLRVL